ncbi:uncharacterized protein PG998_003058 [Apiospora kogelbergensis]|uniref:uncharacterized protein n=1 Tax=Apiospora kogelbergensis TaxID=1337665 RepID=UPI003130320E
MKIPVSQIVLNEASILDLTPQVADGRLSWMAPAGNATWKLIAVYEKYTNQRSCAAATGATDVIANGSWIVDHFSAAGAKKITDFWDTTLLDTEEMKLLVSDVVKYFPPPYNETWVYGANGSSVKAAVLADYRKTLTEGNQEYLRHLVDWSHNLGVEYSSQPGYNIPVDMSALTPILDAPETESLGFPTEDDMRQFSGTALLAGKSVVSNEVGAVRGAAYSQTVPELLGLFQKSFAAGISMQVIYGFGYTGEFPRMNWPGFTAFGYGFTEMWNHKTPAWNHFQDVMDFAARHMLILQRETPKVDIAGYYYPAPFDLKSGLPTETLKRLGFSYDYLGPENLSPDLEVEEGILAPSRSSYRALVFANTTAISGYTMKAITAYAEKGLPVFFVGGVPSACRGVNACPDGEPAQLLQALMREHKNVQVVPRDDDLPAALRSAGVVPRASFAPASEDYVFVFNAGQAASTHSTSFEVDPARVPSVLDAWTGKRTTVLEYEQTENGIVIPVSLQPNQTRIYVFSKPPAGGAPSFHIKSSSGALEGLSVSKEGVVEAQVSGPANLTQSYCPQPRAGRLDSS